MKGREKRVAGSGRTLSADARSLQDLSRSTRNGVVKTAPFDISRQNVRALEKLGGRNSTRRARSVSGPCCTPARGRVWFKGVAPSLMPSWLAQARRFRNGRSRNARRPGHQRSCRHGAHLLAPADIFSNCDEPLTCGNGFPHMRPQLRHSCGAFAVDRHNPVKHAPQ